MPLFTIIETDAGLTVAQLEPSATPDDAAVRHRGVVADPNVYKTYDDAYDAILARLCEDDEEEDG